MGVVASRIQVLMECPHCRKTDMDVLQYDKPKMYWGEARCSGCGWTVHKISFPEQERGSLRFKAKEDAGEAPGEGGQAEVEQA